MLYYHKRFPNNLSAIQMYTAHLGSDLPEGVYAFLERYCCNIDCDCREVKIEIMPQSAMNLGYFEISDTLMATLRYSWELPLSDHNPYFHETDPQSEWADAARQVFVDYVQVSPGYNDELATRFLLMKLEPNLHTKLFKPQTTIARSTPKLGRNESCFCGSGKKYKKCCLEK